CGDLRAETTRERGERRCPLVCGPRFDAVAPALAPDQVDCARADRAGGAEQRDRAPGLQRRFCETLTRRLGLHRPHHSNRPRAGAAKPPRTTPSSAATALAAMTPSRRAMSPPCPAVS